MQKIQNIMVMGAGAVGGYFGAVLDKNTESRVVYIARGSHLEAMLLNGLHVDSEDNSFKLQVTASDDPSTVEETDLILFTVKSYSTDQAIDKIRPVVNEHTQILTLQNGIENYPKLVAAFGKERVIQGFCRIGASVPEPGVIRHSSMGEITVGDPYSLDAGRLRSVCNLFDEGGVPCTISDDIEHDVWVKFTWNCVFNMLTAVANVTVDYLYSSEEGIDLCHRVFDELQRVAATQNVSLTEEDRDDVIDGARKLKGFKTSTYQDRNKGKPLEFEAFTGAVVRLADRYNVDIPVNRTLYALLKTIDNAITE